MINVEGVKPVFFDDIGGVIIAILAKAKCLDFPVVFEQAGIQKKLAEVSVFAVCYDYAGIFRAESEIAERLGYFGFVFVVVEVVGLDIEDDGDLGFEVQEAAVVFAGLGDEMVSAADA